MKIIAKELASMPNSLPLNDSNSIFVCLDEGRCDIVKVLISGPDDTPYQNGLFEFDVFFPTRYFFCNQNASNNFTFYISQYGKVLASFFFYYSYSNVFLCLSFPYVQSN